MEARKSVSLHPVAPFGTAESHSGVSLTSPPFPPNRENASSGPRLSRQLFPAIVPLRASPSGFIVLVNYYGQVQRRAIQGIRPLSRCLRWFHVWAAGLKGLNNY